MLNDKELLELAAKAAGYNTEFVIGAHVKDKGDLSLGMFLIDTRTSNQRSWNPLSSDGDALLLAVKLNLNIEYDSCPDGVIVFVYGNWDGSPDSVTETFEGKSRYAAVRRAIVRAAAEIGRNKEC